jgi:hypothetical protein
MFDDPGEGVKRRWRLPEGVDPGNLQLVSGEDPALGPRGGVR